MKNKKILTSIGVLFLSAIAATSGTFAWFLTARQVSVQYSGASIYAMDGNLVIAYKSSMNNIDTDNDVSFEAEDNILTIDNNQEVTDISGDGLSFYKVNWSSTDDVASGIRKISVEDAGDADGYFVDFTITISRVSSDVSGFKAFLGDGTAILPVDDSKAEDLGIVKATRMVVIDNAGAVIIRYGVDNETGPKYLVEGTDNDAYSSGTHSFKSDTLYKYTPFETKNTIATAEALYPAIADLTTDTSADVTFRFFIEGTDPDAKNDYLKGMFKVDLGIYALYS